MPHGDAGLVAFCARTRSARHNTWFGIMSQFMEGCSVEMRGALEGVEGRQADEIITGSVIRLAKAFPDGGAAA
jgi:hypothetical protein